ncbi:hypothetical protein WA577_002160, partial [Blastocystis sp. JDR]
MSDVVLHYFGSKARAESIKLALYLAHIPYKFEPVQDWPKMKEEGLKSGSLPFGQVPMLHMDGMDMVQTVAILRYISANYLSKNLAPKEAVTVDMMVEGWNDFLNEAYQFIYVHKDQLPQFWENGAKKNLTNLENFYKRIGKRFMAADVPTIADAHAYTTLRQLKALKSDLLADYPALQKWEKDMDSLEEVKAYMTSD